MAYSSILRTSGVYKITCITNGKIYIGSSISVDERWNDHKYNLRRNKHNNPHFQAAWNNYGEQSFVFEVIEVVTPIMLQEREQYWLDELKPHDRLVGFNIGIKADSGMRGRKATPEAIKKAADAHKGRKQPREAIEKTAAANRGRKHSPEFCAAISARMKGVAKSPETRAKMSIAKKGKKLSVEHVEKIRLLSTGRKHSQATKEKMALNSHYHYLYCITNPQGDKYIIRSLFHFCKDHGLSAGHMYSIVTGKRSHHKGWTVKRVTA